jgi:hypothetical protein
MGKNFYGTVQKQQYLRENIKRRNSKVYTSQRASSCLKAYEQEQNAALALLAQWYKSVFEAGE